MQPASFAPAAAPTGAASAPRSFGDLVSRAMEEAVQQTRAADTVSTQALAGQAGTTEVVLAVSKAEMALQTAVVLRDRVVAAYQDIMRMPI
ncbi:flagellar hook-basal body complex protein FliE [Roseicella aquatilis]|uniref:Flagellar hook-basal body complex protein FliE n=2 Tax=Roseicella aquatilis TaxID=2527868 RepID=A0A4R4D3Q4_9PROT|nr:flagellar hook-basal body complex protein FliE [Roseicella aquatilis]